MTLFVLPTDATLLFFAQSVKMLNVRTVHTYPYNMFEVKNVINLVLYTTYQLGFEH